ADAWSSVSRLLMGQRCGFVLNETNDLAVFPDDAFDFVYSSLVLQHMKPEYSQNYIKEFLRVLAPGGLPVFQIPRQPLQQRELPYKAQVQLEPPPLELEPGQRITLPVRVKNASNLVWPAVNVGNHWLSETNEKLQQDDGRAALPTGMRPQEEAEVAIT